MGSTPADPCDGWVSDRENSVGDGIRGDRTERSRAIFGREMFGVDRMKVKSIRRLWEWQSKEGDFGQPIQGVPVDAALFRDQAIFVVVSWLWRVFRSLTNPIIQ